MRGRTGSIDITSSGRYRVRISVRGKRETLGIFDDEAEAVSVRDGSADVLRKEDCNGDLSLKDWGDKCLTEREIGHEVRDPDTDWSRWRCHIESDPIAKVPLAGLRRRHVRAWVKRVRSRVGAAQTAQNTLNLLRVVLGMAVDEEIIDTNPAASVRVKRDARTEEDWTFLSPEEQENLIAAVNGPEKWIVAFAIHTGIRAGELVTLRLADVHIDDPEPHIIVRYGSAPDLPTKTGKIRRVELLPHALDAARRWMDALPSFASANWKKLMFPRKRGGFRDENHVIRWEAWKGAPARKATKKMPARPAVVGALEAAGITRNVRWHDLRHTCASSLVSGWWGRMWHLQEVQAVLGHASITTTERYAHLAETALKRAARETREAVIAASKPISPEPPDQLATNRPHGAQVVDIATVSSDFLNRRSQVRLLSGAPPGKQARSADHEQTLRGQLEANSRDLLVALKAGRDEEVWRLATELAEGVLGTPMVRMALDVLDAGPHAISRALELAEAVLAGAPSESKAEVES